MQPLQIFQIQEIVDLIVDHLFDTLKWGPQTPGRSRPTYPASLEFPELKDCALINKAFAFRPQKYLFSKLCFIRKRILETYRLPETERTSPRESPSLDDSSLQSLDNLLLILDKKPYLANHLRLIKANGDFGYLVRRHEQLGRLLDIMKVHGNPRSVTLFSDYYNGDDFSPPHDYTIQKSICTHLETLECGSMKDVPFWFIAGNPKLQSLSLMWCDAEDTSEAELSDSSMSHEKLPLFISRPKLKYMLLDHSWDIIASILRWTDPRSGVAQPAVDFSYLTRLHVGLSVELGDVRTVQRVIDIAGPSLKELTMSTHDYEAESYCEKLDLSSCTNLSSALIVAAIINNSITRDYSPFDRLIETIASIPPSGVNRMQNLEITVYLPVHSRDHAVWRQLYLSLPWETLDRCINRIAPTGPAPQYALDCSFHLECYLGYMDTSIDSYDDAVRECEGFAEDLKTRRFPMMASNTSILCEVSATFSVDYLH